VSFNKSAKTVFRLTVNLPALLIRLSMRFLRELHLTFGALDGIQQPFFVKGFENIIRRVYFKRFEREFVVSGHENDERHIFRADDFDHFKAADLRHLNIEKNQVGREFSDGVDSFAPVGAFADNLDFRVFAEMSSDKISRQRYVVNYQCSNFHFVFLLFSTPFGVLKRGV